MNELLQKHGCANVFSVPEGLKELMADISREVLREQPVKIFDFISNYLSVLMITREHGVMAVKILDDLCDCRPSVSEHLIALGIEAPQATRLADVIKIEIEQFEPVEGNETIKETQIMKKILTISNLDEVMSSKVCQVARNAYRDFWYRKKTLEQSLKTKPDEPWEIAAERTLEMYKRTKPSFNELNRAAVKIQAAYKGYHLRRNVLSHLKRKPKTRGPKVDLHGPPLDVAESREIDLGQLIDITVPKDDLNSLFSSHATKKMGLPYDPMLTITHVPREDSDFDIESHRGSSVPEPSILIMGRESRSPQAISNIITEAVRQSHIPSVAATVEETEAAPPESQDVSMHRISFSEVPPEIIPDVVEVEEVKEIMKPVFEEADADAAEAEIPEDIPDNVTEPEVSAATDVPSAPETADGTDVEDDENAAVTTDEEEG